MKTIILTIALALNSLTASAQLGNTETNFWNNFVDFLNTKGVKGSVELDNKENHISQNLFEEFNKINHTNYDYKEFVTNVQIAIKLVREELINEIKQGHDKNGNKVTLEGYTIGDTTYDFDTNFMSGLSKVDGWAGSKTTSYKFPNHTIQTTIASRGTNICVSNHNNSVKIY